MRVTRYFEAMRQRPDRAIIRLEGIEHVLARPVREQIQRDGRIRRCAAITEMTVAICGLCSSWTMRP